MKDLRAFMKDKQASKENVDMAVTKALTDENGNPLKWTLRPIGTKEHEEIRESAFKTVEINGKKGLYRKDFDMKKYKDHLITRAVVHPDLKNAQLQDSYGVKKPEELIKEMIPNPGEYDALFDFISDYNGIISFEEKVDEAKNS